MVTICNLVPYAKCKASKKVNSMEVEEVVNDEQLGGSPNFEDEVEESHWPNDIENEDYPEDGAERLLYDSIDIDENANTRLPAQNRDLGCSSESDDLGTDTIYCEMMRKVSSGPIRFLPI